MQILNTLYITIFISLFPILNYFKLNLKKCLLQFYLILKQIDRLTKASPMTFIMKLLLLTHEHV